MGKNMNDCDWVTPEWMQSGLDALRESLDVSAAQKRQMIQFLYDCGLWDEKKLAWPNAVTRFNNCLNPSRPDFFKPVEVWLLMKRFDRPAFFLALAEDLGYEVKRHVTPERHTAALERLASALEEANRLAGLAATLVGHTTSDPPAQRVHAALQDGTGAFAIDADGDVDVTETGGF